MQKDYYKHSLSLKRTILSIKQTKMAARRTLLSYISTGTVFISLALAYIKFLDTKVDAVSLIMFGVALVFLIFGVVDYIIVQHSIKDLMHELVIEEKEEHIESEKENKEG